MKKWILAAAILGAVSLQTVSASPLVLNFANLFNSSINFDGAGNFSFPNSGANDFQINGESGGSAALGLFGNISNGNFAIGAVTTAAGVETAAVTGTGILTITDASAVNFSATLNWMSITTSGASGTINQLAQVNLTGLTYTGTNADLIAFKNSTGGIGTVTFQFTDTTHDLNFLKANATSTSYSGSLSAVPEPMTFSLMGVGLLGLGLLRKRLS